VVWPGAIEPVSATSRAVTGFAVGGAAAFAGARPPTTTIATSMRPYRNIARRITWLEIRRSFLDPGF
jgi:hypothetical protein